MKPVILTFARYYLPGYRAGGPIRTIANMVSALGDTFDFRIVALDHDLGDIHPYPNIETDTWIPCGNALVRYVSLSKFGLRKIQEIARSTPHDVIYLNSFFDPRFTQMVLVNHRLGWLSERPIVLASRGEFSEGALKIKAWKKLAFIRFAKLFRLYNGLTWQASSDREAEDIQRALSVTERLAGRLVVSGHVAAAPDLAASEKGAVASTAYMPDGPFRVCTISRISPMKNLDFALRVLAEVRVPVRFSIYGPIEDQTYWAECQALISKLPSNIEVVYEGAVEPAMVVQVLARHGLFLFPTRGENFGHVIHEALRAGLPLLISDQTPWQGLEEHGVGWEMSLADSRQFALRIEEVSRWAKSEREQCSERSRNMAANVGGDPGTLEANRRLFLDAMSNAAIGSKLRQVGSRDESSLG